MSEDNGKDYGITAETIAAAEKIIGIEFTDDERQQMLNYTNTRAGWYERLRETKLGNSVAPAFKFDPRLLESDYVGVNSQPVIMSDIGEIERPANLENVAFWPLTHLAQLVKTKQVTSVELTEMYMARLKHFNKWLECVVTFTDDLAMEQARRADEEIAAGNYRGPLHGIPWGAKDLLAVPGYKTTWGAMPFKEQTIDMMATVVKRLEEAGAVLIAKLASGALAYGDIWFGGTTKNPWDISEGSSGSSAGPGSATAAGLVGFSIGTETLGSIVSPSTRNGVTGLRPTFGRVSRHGCMALSWSMDKIGPMCRSVEDCGLVFNAIYGPDGLDDHVIDELFAWDANNTLNGLKIGYLKSAFDEERENKANDDTVLDVLRGWGVQLIPIELPEIDLQPLLIILLVEGAAAMDEITRDNLDDQMQWQDEDAWPNTFRQARLIPAVEYIQANRVRTLAMQQMSKVMQEIDVFVTPSFGGSSLLLTNLTGHPSVVLPNGFTEKNTPTSISFVGNLYQENKVLTVAKAYQDATDFHKQYPTMKY
jgi:Asp-tRNA(Asn)/Glu-tRNA(Gln) amidotransferase A subunit family amidase